MRRYRKIAMIEPNTPASGTRPLATIHGRLILMGQALRLALDHVHHCTARRLNAGADQTDQNGISYNVTSFAEI